MWNGLSGVSRPGEKVIRFGGGHQQHTAGPEDPETLGHELALIPEMLDDLEVHHHVHGASARGQVGEIPPQVHLHPRVAGADVRHRGFVVVHPR